LLQSFADRTRFPVEVKGEGQIQNVREQRFAQVAVHAFVCEAERPFAGGDQRLDAAVDKHEETDEQQYRHGASLDVARAEGIDGKLQQIRRERAEGCQCQNHGQRYEKSMAYERCRQTP
jgi:hypothetical protein